MKRNPPPYDPPPLSKGDVALYIAFVIAGACLLAKILLDWLP